MRGASHSAQCASGSVAERGETHPLRRTLPASSRASLACLNLALCAVCVLPTYNMRTYFLPFAHFVRGSPDPSAWWLLCLPLCLPLCLEQRHPLEHGADERILLLDAQRVRLQLPLQLRIGRAVL